MNQPLPPGALAGVRVIDLTQMLSGPFATMLLVDMGADVLKVEPPQGDGQRQLGPLAPDDTLRSFGGNFQSINRGKRSIAIDLRTDAGREILLRLVRGADILAENFRPGVMERLGIRYERLREENPALVYACVRGFGDPRTGVSPYADWPAYDIVAQAMGGAMSMTGPGEGQPLPVGPNIGDIVPGLFFAVGILGALHHARATGQGQFVDVAMMDGVLAVCNQLVFRHSYLGEVGQPRGNTHPSLVPFEAFPARDGKITIAVPMDHFWQELCRCIERPDLGDDPRLGSIAGRYAHAALVREEVGKWTSARTRAEVIAALAGRVPCGPVNTIADLVADPHTAAREMLVDVAHPGIDRAVQVPGSAIKMTETPSLVRGRAPLIGEHTVEVLRGLAYGEESIGELLAAGVVRTEA